MMESESHKKIKIMPKFKFRGFTSLLMFFSFLISLISGIVLYFPPQGKIANWTHWTFWGLEKEMWGALHINASLIVFLIVILHLYYNWKILFRYVKKKAELAFNLKLELFTAAALSLFIILATLYNLEPFRTIIKWNNDIKNYWVTQAQTQPPIPHAEDLTVTEFCEQLSIPLENFRQHMNQQGWKFNGSEDKIIEIAARNGISPAAIYNLVKGADHNKPGQAISGWGRKSLAQVCVELDQDIAEAIKKLAANGVTASKDDQLKDLAEKNNLRPMDIVNLINAIDNRK
ncbi:DUF4405 domain-containing protein [candidate division KSB1 bacterium]|nr:DUF4405 domain-containing protein [candidate division KSB1 bacterium]